MIFFKNTVPSITRYETIDAYFNEAQKKIEADFFISVGKACRPAFWLNKHELRTCANPLDWMIQNDLNAIIKLYDKKFDKFFEKRIDMKSSEENEYRIVYDTAFNITAMHSFKKKIDDAEAYTDFSKTMKRRFHRMDDFIKKSNTVAFICNRTENIYYFRKFLIAMKKLYKDTNFIFILFRHRKNKECVREITFGNEVIIYEFSFNDTHQDGSSPAHNINFWKGNEEKWMQVCSHLKRTDCFCEVDVNIDDLAQK